MGQIKLLPETLANQIAAGEVVQRPASIVKELIENSLDAGAKSIKISLKAGGKAGISIVDDGCGMDQDDVLLAYERHATSKIDTLSDLDSIHSFGFRGEALPSIAAISRIQMISAMEDGEGVQLVIEGGKIFSVKPIGTPKGTTITVKRLFFNTPARRKFLKSTFTEYQHCLNVVTKFAIVQYGVSWTLQSNDKTVLQLTPVNKLEERIAQIFGADYLNSVISFSGNRDEIQINGLIGNLFLARSNRSQQYFYVNGRPVQNKTLLYTVSNATKNILPKGKYPVVFIDVKVSPKYVDVNVHPAKTEVRFREEWIVHDLLTDLLKDILQHNLPKAGPFPSQQPQSFNNQNYSPVFTNYNKSSSEKENFIQVEPAENQTNFSEEQSSETQNSSKNYDELKNNFPKEQFSKWDDNFSFFKSLRYVGQVLRSFIVFEKDNEMIILDQHAAHERILFEEILERLEKSQIPRQQLLISETLEFSPAEFNIVMKQRQILESLGFELEEFGRNTIVIRSVPAWLKQADPRPILLEIIDDIKMKLDIDKPLLFEAREELAKILSCKTAIKIHRKLAIVEVEKLISDLSKKKFPFSCPHGRPIIVTFNFQDFERMFKR